jgi:predicted methyltransferase
MMKSTLPLVAALGLLAGGPAWAEHHDQDALTDAIAGEHRSEANRARDRWRHPRETLEFFGFAPDLTVVELWPGGGWYTEILAPALAGEGRLILATYGEGPDPTAYRARNHRTFMAKIDASPQLYGEAELIEFWPPASTSLGASGSADLVLTFRNIHSLVRRDQHEAFFAAAYDVLKPGGVLGVVQHRAPEGADVAASADKGYVPTAFVVEQAESAGFELVASSEINANPKDTKDYEVGVWALPPSLDAKDGREDAYRAIGESDRMTLRFRKPAAD